MAGKPVYLVLLILLFASALHAQRKLIIAKRAHPARYEFYEGEEIRFKLKGEKFWTKALIQGMGEGYIRLHYAQIDLSEIELIDVRHKRQSNLLMTTTSILLIGAVGFPAMELVNGPVRNGEPFDSKSLKIGAYLLTGGILLLITKRRKVKFGHRYFLRIGEY